jgi:cytochrome c oxidase assembly factor CtaG
MNMVVSHWSANVAALAVYAVAAAAHLLGMRGEATGSGPSRQPHRLARAVACQAGLLLALLAVVSPMGYWSYRFIWARSLQDVVLAIVAPALIVLGAPWRPLSRGLRLDGRLHRRDPRTAGDADDDDAARRNRAAGWRAWPIAVAVTFCAIWWAWHLPALFDAALHSPIVYALEVTSYLAVGTLLWLQLIDSPPLRPQLSPLRRVGLLLGVAASGTVLGLIRVYGSGLAYPAYLGFRHHVLSVISDQQVGGAVLWVIPLVPFSIVAVALAVGWLSEDESEATAADFDRLLRRKSAWPSRPGLR